MRTIAISVAVALAAQFLALASTIGAQNFSDAIGWTIILGIFFSIPSILFFATLFFLLRWSHAPSWSIIPASVIVPATAAAVIGGLDASNWLLVISIAGGIAGGVALFIQKDNY